jgi:hypothetical protein
MVNKRDTEVFIVCLSCHFDMGQFSYHRAGGTLLVFSMIHVCLQWQELTWDLRQLAWFKYSYSRDMRFSTYDLSSIYLIFVLALTLTNQDANDRGNESSKLISTIIFGKFIKLAITASLYEGPIFYFYFYVESSSSTFMHWLREHSCHSEYNVHSPKIYYWLIYDYGIACSQIICI